MRNRNKSMDVFCREGAASLWFRAKVGWLLPSSPPRPSILPLLCSKTSLANTSSWMRRIVMPYTSLRSCRRPQAADKCVAVDRDGLVVTEDDGRIFRVTGNSASLVDWGCSATALVSVVAILILCCSMPYMTKTRYSSWTPRRMMPRPV